ncbi:MAG: EAL and HDOD domain-containing protein [Terracidiphilus sp.]
MATHVAPSGEAAGTLAEFADELRYFARQPILDLRGRVHGYELLFRNGPHAAFSGDGDLATRTMLDNSVIFGIERLTGGLPAFVNCTRESLVDELVHVLPAGMTVLELLEDLEPTESLIAACRKLKAAGFRLALDDFSWRPGIEPLLELADYVKVDFIQTAPPERKALLERLSRYTMALVAEKVETQEEYEQARAEGFTLIQGYYFCRPVLLKGQRVPANRLSHIQILRHLRNDPLDLRQLSELVKRDPSLTYRLLRLVNSPMSALRQEVRSIEAALLAVGDEVFRRIATLAIATEMNTGQPPALLRLAFVRGRFCEQAADLCALDPTEQYLLGLLSLLSAMLLVPMKDLTPSLPFREEIRRALEGAPVPEAKLLEWLLHHEMADWEGCDAVGSACGLDPRAAMGRYADAVVWAEDALHFAE